MSLSSTPETLAWDMTSSMCAPRSHCQFHDGIDYIVGVVFQRLNRLHPGDVGLGHDQLNVLVLHPTLVDIFIVIIIGLNHRRRTSGATASYLTRLGNLWHIKLLSRVHLSLLGQVLNLCFSKDDVGVAGGVLVDVRLVDHKQNVLGLPDGHATYSGHLLQSKFGHDLPGLLLSLALLGLADQLLVDAGRGGHGVHLLLLTTRLLQL